MKYAEYPKLDKKLEDKLDDDDNCMYKKRNYNFYSNQCEGGNSNLQYIIDEDSMDKCKLIYNNRIGSNVVSNKNNKQLAHRVIKTIPYRNNGDHIYNSDLEIIMNSGQHTNNRKSVSNTSEIQTEKKPMIDFIKNRLDDKNTSFDISRFQLSSRQIKGNKVYVNNYKKNLKKIKLSLNDN